jgi:hypothetical protein
MLGVRAKDKVAFRVIDGRVEIVAVRFLKTSHDACAVGKASGPSQVLIAQQGSTLEVKKAPSIL